MQFQVINRTIHVDEIRVAVVASSSILLVGDAEKISLSSLFDTPSESVEFISGPGPESIAEARFGTEEMNDE